MFSLPKDVLLIICDNLDCKNLGRLKQTCKFFNTLINEKFCEYVAVMNKYTNVLYLIVEKIHPDFQKVIDNKSLFVSGSYKLFRFLSRKNVIFYMQFTYELYKGKLYFGDRRNLSSSEVKNQKQKQLLKNATYEFAKNTLQDCIELSRSILNKEILPILKENDIEISRFLNYNCSEKDVKGGIYLSLEQGVEHFCNQLKDIDEDGIYAAVLYTTCDITGVPVESSIIEFKLPGKGKIYIPLLGYYNTIIDNRLTNDEYCNLVESCKVYTTQDNGSEPFQVVNSENVNENINIVTILTHLEHNYYGSEDEDEDEKEKYLYVVGRYENVIDIMVGKDLDNKIWDGSAVLIQIKSENDKFRYVHIGTTVYEFSTSELITKFHSRMGNNTVTDPIGESENYVYFMRNDMKKVKKSVMGLDTDWYNSYYLFYQLDEKYQQDAFEEISLIHMRKW